MKKLLFLILFLLSVFYVQAQTTTTFKTEPLVLTKEYGQYHYIQDAWHKEFTSYTVESILNSKNELYQRVDFIDNYHINLNDIIQINSTDSKNYRLHNRKWQLPPNGSFLITSYDSINGVPDFDNPNYFLFSSRKDTIIEIQFIREQLELESPTVIHPNQELLLWEYPTDDSSLLAFNIYAKKDDETTASLYNGSPYYLAYVMREDKESTQTMYFEGTFNNILAHSDLLKPTNRYIEANGQQIQAYEDALHYWYEIPGHTYPHAITRSVDVALKVNKRNFRENGQFQYITAPLSPGTYDFYVQSLSYSGEASELIFIKTSEIK